MPSSDSNEKNHLSKDELKTVCKLHNLGKFKGITQKFRSKTNTNLLIQTSEGQFVIRSIRDPLTKERVDYIQGLLRYLLQNKVPVINAIKTNDGNYVSTINEKTIQVTPFVEAYSYNRDTIQIENAAKALKKIHTVLVDYPQGPLPSYSIHPTNERLEMEMYNLYLNKKIHSSSSLKKIEKLYLEILSNLKKQPTNLPKTIIHDDWHPKNLLYNKDGSVAYVLDYDGFQRAERIYDVAYAIYQLQSKKNRKFKKNFLHHYGEITPEERTVLPFIIAKVAFWFVLQYRDYPEFLDSQVVKHEYFIHDLLYKQENYLK